MKNILQALVFSLCMVVLWGCPYGSPYSAGNEKKAVVIKSLPGKWINRGIGLNQMKIQKQKKGKGYDLHIPKGTTYDDGGMMALDTLYNFHINKIDKHLIASVKERAPGGKYFFFKVEMRGNDEMAISEVDEKKFKGDAPSSEKEFRTLLNNVLKDSTSFIEKKFWKRKA